ncbi:MAG: hypothetical protein KGQ59_02380 [Bdellovibrionales bacterium]|nr:hypothetical protein [Bdellovibrionales bacterium]
MANTRKKNPAKGPSKNPAKSGPTKGGIKAIFSAIRGKAKPAPATKAKAAAPAAPKAKTKGKAPQESKSAKPVAQKVMGAKTAAKSPLKGQSKTSTSAAVVSAVKGKAIGAKNSAAVAAAAAVQKVTARLSGRGSIDPSAESVCREVACEGLGTTAGYCRLHYIKNWRKIKRKEVILREGKLNVYIEELVAKYPEKYLEAIRNDLANDKEFAKVIRDLDLDESIDDFEGEGGDGDVVIDTIKRDFDDDTEAF